MTESNVVDAGALRVLDPQPPMAVTQPQAATPAFLLQLAVQQGADINKLERLMDLQQRWEAGEARKAFNVAFAAFKAEGVRVVKNVHVNDGPLKGKRYADLFAVVDTLTPALSRHGLSASWKLTKDEKDWLEVTCVLSHVGGHSEVVSMGGPPDAGGAKNAIQARASAQSYLRRYTFLAITGMAAADEDDDGRGAGAPVECAEIEPDRALMNGTAAASEGLQALTAWWGKLSARERGRLSQDFGRLKRAAAQVDAQGAT